MAYTVKTTKQKYLTENQRKANIRSLSTTELKTYKSAYKKGQVYHWAYVTAENELKRRSK